MELVSHQRRDILASDKSIVQSIDWGSLAYIVITQLQGLK